MKRIAPALLSLALAMSVALPASASASVTPAYNDCPLPVQEPALVRMVDSLATMVFSMLGISTGGCSAG